MGNAVGCSAHKAGASSPKRSITLARRNPSKPHVLITKRGFSCSRRAWKRFSQPAISMLKARARKACPTRCFWAQRTPCGTGSARVMVGLDLNKRDRKSHAVGARSITVVKVLSPYGKNPLHKLRSVYHLGSFEAPKPAGTRWASSSAREPPPNSRLEMQANLPSILASLLMPPTAQSADAWLPQHLEHASNLPIIRTHGDFRLCHVLFSDEADLAQAAVSHPNPARCALLEMAEQRAWPMDRVVHHARAMGGKQPIR